MGPLLRKYNIGFEDLPWEDLTQFAERQPEFAKTSETYTDALPRMIGEAIQSNDLGRLVERFEGVLYQDRAIDAAKRNQVVAALKAWLSDKTDESKRRLLASIGSLQVQVTKNVVVQQEPSSQAQWIERKAVDATSMKRKQVLLKERLAMSIERRSRNTGSAHYIRSKVGDPKFPASSKRSSHAKEVTTRMEEPRFISTDYDERFEYNRPDSVVPKAHSHSVCYHDRESYRGRSGYYAKTSRYEPLSREEYRMLKHGDFLHCHYRHDYSPGHVQTYIKQSLADFKAQKEERKLAEQDKQARKVKVKEYVKKVEEKNKGIQKKEFEPPVNGRFVAGVAEPPKEKKTIKPEERRVASSHHKPNYLKPKQKLSENPEVNKDQPISVYYLKLRQERDKKAFAEAQQKKDEERKKQDEEKRLRREKIHELALSKGITEQNLGTMYKLLEQERKLKEKQEKQEKKLLKMKLKAIERKAMEEREKAKKRSFQGDSNYIFNTTLDPSKPDVTPATKDAMAAKEQEFKQERARAASAEYRKVSEAGQDKRRAKTRDQKKVHFESQPNQVKFKPEQNVEQDDQQEQYQVMTHSVEVKQRSKLLNAEREMLEEIHDSIQKTQLHLENGEGVRESGTSKKDFNDHLIIDPREAIENDFFGLRPNPILKQTNFQPMKGLPVTTSESKKSPVGGSKIKSKLKQTEDVSLPKGRPS